MLSLVRDVSGGNCLAGGQLEAPRRHVSCCFQMIRYVGMNHPDCPWSRLSLVVCGLNRYVGLVQVVCLQLNRVVPGPGCLWW
jgi:hypothetical protein